MPHNGNFMKITGVNGWIMNTIGCKNVTCLILTLIKYIVLHIP